MSFAVTTVVLACLTVLLTWSAARSLGSSAAASGYSVATPVGARAFPGPANTVAPRETAAATAPRPMDSDGQPHDGAAVSMLGRGTPPSNTPVGH